MNYRSRKQITLVPSLIILKFPQSQNQAGGIGCFATEFQKRSLGCLYGEWKGALFWTWNGRQLHLGGILVWFPCLKIYPNCLSPSVESHCERWIWRILAPLWRKWWPIPAQGGMRWKLPEQKAGRHPLECDQQRGGPRVSSGQGCEMNLRCKLQSCFAQTHRHTQYD